MTNLYPANVPLTADLLSAQEQRRDDALSDILEAVLPRPGVCSGLDVTLNPRERTVTVQPGIAVWPDDTGRWRLCRVPEAQTLALPEGDGQWQVALHADAQVLTQPTTLLDNGVPTTVYLASERLAYAAGGFPATTGQQVRAGLTVSSDGGGQVLAKVDAAGESVSLTPVEHHAMSAVPTTGELVEKVLAELPAPPALPDVEELAHQAAALIPAPPSAEALVAEVLAQLPAPQPAPAPPALPDVEELARRAAALVPAPPSAEELTQAVAAKLKPQDAVRVPVAYLIQKRQRLDSSNPAPRNVAFTLPQEPPTPGTLTFTGIGDVVSVSGRRVVIRPETEDVPEAPMLWSFTDPDLRVGDTLGINGPNAGFYVSTLSPLRDPATTLQERTEGGLLRWKHILQRYTPGLPVPVVVVDTALSDVAADVLVTPMPLSTLGGVLMWGNRPQAFAVSENLPTQTDPNLNTIGAYVNGRRLLTVDREGAHAVRTSIVIDGTLLVTPLSAAPTTLSEEAQ